MKKTHTAYWERPTEGDEESELTVRYQFTPGTPETGRSGLPENCDPGAGAEVHIVSVSGIFGDPITLTADETDALKQFILDTHEEPGIDPDEAHDRQQDDRAMRDEAETMWHDDY